MNKIRPWLYIGKYSDTKNLTSLQNHTITAMLQLAAPVPQPNITHLYLPVEDGEPLPHIYLQQGLDFIRQQRAHNQRLLIACGAGVSRAATFTIAALVDQEQLPLLDAYHLIKQHRPIIMPHPALWTSLCQYYQQEIPFQQLFNKR
ncbi:MAG TPA: dual specificity protein phosphatase [Anaerolineae bacterium]|nr:dual specificity protein phosphatase [Anaerolineae bacterium]